MPLIIYDPRVDKSQFGRVDSRMVLNLDVAPTILAYAGIEIPDHYQGAALGGLVAGQQTDDWRNDFFCEHLMENRSIPKWEGVRGERFVYAHYLDQDYEFLHDLKVDPDQLRNLADDPEYQETLEKMRARCLQLRDFYGGEYVSRKTR